MSRYQFSPSRNQTRIIHDDGSVEVVQGQVNAPEDSDFSAAPTDGSSFYRPEDHPQPEVPKSQAAVYGLADGVTARHTDELGAMVDTAGDYFKGELGGANPQVADVLNRYRQHVNQNRVELDRGRAQHPGTALTAEVAGGLAGPLGKMRGVAGAAGAGAAYGHGDSVGEGRQVVEDSLKGGLVGGALGYAGAKVAPRVGSALEKGAYKTLQGLSKPSTGRRFVATVGVGNAIGTGIGGLVGGPVGGMIGSTAGTVISPYLAKGVSGLAQKGAKAMERNAAARALKQPHAILTHEMPMYEASGRPTAQALRSDILDRGGRAPVGVSGKYMKPEITEHSQMTRGLPPSAAAELGKKYGQESVILSGNGNNALLYTNGENAGKAVLGKGTTFFDEDPGLYRSTMKNPLSGKDTHFSHNLDFDAGPQNFNARAVAQKPQMPGSANAGGMVGGAAAVAGGGATNENPEARRNRDVRLQLADSSSRHINDKALAGKVSRPTATEATTAIQWIAANVKNPYYAKQAMQKVVEEPNMAKQIVGGLREGMAQNGEEEGGLYGGRKF